MPDNVLRWGCDAEKHWLTRKLMKGKAKMPKPRVTKLNVKGKYNKIIREHDNTTDLERAEMVAHGKFKGLRAPDLAVPGKQVTAPPRTETNLPG